MSPRSVCVVLLCVAASALAKPQDFNSLTNGNHFVVQAQPVAEGGGAAGAVPLLNGIPLSGPAAFLAGDKSKFISVMSVPAGHENLGVISDSKTSLTKAKELLSKQFTISFPLSDKCYINGYYHWPKNIE